MKRSRTHKVASLYHKGTQQGKRAARKRSAHTARGAAWRPGEGPGVGPLKKVATHKSGRGLFRLEEAALRERFATQYLRAALRKWFTKIHEPSAPIKEKEHQNCGIGKRIS